MKIPIKMDNPSLTREIILFSRFLKDHGLNVFFSNIMGSLKSLTEINISSKDDFFYALRANMVSNDVEWGLFHDLFDRFWKTKPDSKAGEDNKEVDYPKQDIVTINKQYQAVNDTIGPDQKDGTSKKTMEMISYSPVSILEKKNIDRFNTDDIQIAQVIAKNLLSSFQVQTTRRTKVSKRIEHMDFRRIMRQSIKSGGIPVELFYRKKRKRLKRLIVFADVSGSMNRYVSFILPFILGFRNVGSKAEVFLFSTSLTPITKIIREFNIEKALEAISETVPDWSGGTRIGYSLNQFREQNGKRLLNKRSVIVIISDGWDLGGRVLLKKEMEIISQKVYQTVWLNPIAGDPDYRPVYLGMKAVLDYIDYFLPANNLHSLKRVGRTLLEIIAGH